MPLFLDQGGTTFTLSFEQVIRLNQLFEKIANELSPTYQNKHELLAILLMQLAHFIIKNLTPSVVKMKPYYWQQNV